MDVRAREKSSKEDSSSDEVRKSSGKSISQSGAKGTTTAQHQSPTRMKEAPMSLWTRQLSVPLLLKPWKVHLKAWSIQW